MDGDSRGYRSAEEQARELTRSIRREVNKLSEQWNALIERSDAWKRKLDDTANVSTSPPHRPPLLAYIESHLPSEHTTRYEYKYFDSVKGCGLAATGERPVDLALRKTIVGSRKISRELLSLNAPLVAIKGFPFAVLSSFTVCR